MLKFSPALKRNIRADDLDDMGESTYLQVRQAIEQGNTEEALALLDYFQREGKGLHDAFCDIMYADLTFIADKFGEEKVYEALKFSGHIIGLSTYAGATDLTLPETMAWHAEMIHAHRTGPGEVGSFSIMEEEDRYVLKMDPCGSGGRMRRIGELDGLPPRTEPPFNLGVTKKAYPWSWSKVGVPYYCLHCCIWSEIMAINKRGYPLRIHEFPENPDDPCTWYYYKKPELIPEEFFKRIGVEKDLSRFQ